ncbi:extensin-like [Sarcophilus harrisii]|uniref:extensin-like n=1 Tax=Sarcophilus harrisii TaxID=9305 RepID=UPI001301BBA4|nr:extensin-like [Sarcophilus harrisii]
MPPPNSGQVSGAAPGPPTPPPRPYPITSPWNVTSTGLVDRGRKTGGRVSPPAPPPPPSLSAPVPGLAAVRKSFSVQTALPEQAGTRATPAWRSHIPRQAASAEKLKEIRCFVRDTRQAEDPCVSRETPPPTHPAPHQGNPFPNSSERKADPNWERGAKPYPAPTPVPRRRVVTPPPPPPTLKPRFLSGLNDLRPSRQQPRHRSAVLAAKMVSKAGDLGPDLSRPTTTSWVQAPHTPKGSGPQLPTTDPRPRLSAPELRGSESLQTFRRLPPNSGPPLPQST